MITLTLKQRVSVALKPFERSSFLVGQRICSWGLLLPPVALPSFPLYRCNPVISFAVSVVPSLYFRGALPRPALGWPSSPGLSRFSGVNWRREGPGLRAAVDRRAKGDIMLAYLSSPAPAMAWTRPKLFGHSSNVLGGHSPAVSTLSGPPNMAVRPQTASVLFPPPPLPPTVRGLALGGPSTAINSSSSEPPKFGPVPHRSSIVSEVSSPLCPPPPR
ncbi:hypothetical protein GQ53DRAFT_76493 [Thozetella sp. PMI_491]|nr:hypothetical protein GQ53DRAFT_76493 [Thozetella sp. PMI_491]